MLEKHHKVRILDEAVEDVGPALAPLHLRPAAPGQVGQPARHGLRPRRDRPGRDAAGRRGRAAAGSTTSNVEIGILDREERHRRRPRRAARRAEPSDGRGGEPRPPRAELEEALGAIEKTAIVERDPRPPRPDRSRHAERAAAPGGDGPAAAPAARRGPGGLQAELDEPTTELEKLQGETPLMQVCVDAQTIAEVVSGWTGIPVGKMVTDEIHTVLSLKDRLEERVIGQSHALEAIAQRIRTAAREPDRPAPADRRLPARRAQRRRQDRDRPDAGRDALRRRAQHDHRSTCREYQEAHTVSRLKGSPPGLRRLRRRRRADRGRPPPALLRRPARRGREGPPRRHGALLPGLRQGHARGRRGARDRLQEHRHPPDLQRRHRHRHEALRRSRDRARARRAGRGAPARAAQDLQAGLPGPDDRRPVLPDLATTSCGRSSSCSSAGSAAGSRRTTGAAFTYDDDRRSPRSPAAARRSRAAPATSTTS